MQEVACLICSVSIRETNAGFDICRACVAFFKRTESAGRKFVCRQGTGQCKFRKHEKFVCRSCRYDRCLEIGMESNTCERLTRPDTRTIIDLIRKSYAQSVARRLLKEKQLAQVLNLNRFTESEDLYMSNIEFFYLIHPFIFKELMCILRQLIPDCANFPETMQASMFINLIGKFNALEYYYLSFGRFKRLGVCMCSLTTVFDMYNIEEWATVQGEILNKDLVTSVRTFAVEYMGIFNRLLQSEAITETEFIAIIVILICQMDTTIDLPDGFQNIFEDIRAQVFKELQDYYRNEMELRDFSSRLGRLMSLTAALSELHLKSEEQIGLYSVLFNVQPLHELLKQAMDE